jgi:serine/threonine protein kinase
MVGRTVSHYRIVAQLGAGGMGVVYRAEDVRLGREVAVKFVSDDAAHDEQAISRLRSEARAASALNHPNICSIFDIGEDNGHPFIVMELMKGQSLRDRLMISTVKVHQLVDIAIAVSDALHATHTDGIIHRDIKPANIFLTDRGHVKVLDFGLAKLAKSADGMTTTEAHSHRTVAGVAIGTVSYMSPEQAAGEELDARTDIFSLGVTLYECATGHHPFPGKTSAVVLAGVLNSTPVAPVTINPELPIRLQEIINNSLEKDRELRYQSAADLRADLKRLRRDLESGQGPVEVVSSRSGAAASAPSREAISTGSAPVVSPESVRPAPSASRGVFVAIATVAAIAGGAYALWPRSAATTPDGQVAVLSDSAIASRLTLARTSLEARNYRAALAYAAEILAADARHPGAVQIRDEAQARLADFDAAIAEARGHLARGDVSATARSLEAARELDAAAPSLVELSSRLSELARERDAAAREAALRQSARPAPLPAVPPDREPSPAAPKPVPPAVAAPAVVVAQPPPAPAPPPAVEPPPSRPTPPPSTPAPSESAPKPAVDPGAERRPPEAAKPAPARQESDEDAIRRVVTAYGRAIESKDIALFRSIKPNLSPDEERRLQQGFQAVSSQQVRLSITSIERKGETALVTVQRRDVLDVNGRRQTVESRQTLAFERVKGEWVISEIR